MISGDEFYDDDVTSGCGCGTHAGCHAGHMDRLHRQRNAKLRGSFEAPYPQNLYAVMGFVQEEHLRLTNQIAHLKDGCTWCEDWGAGFDPEPCPRHTEPA